MWPIYTIYQQACKKRMDKVGEPCSLPNLDITLLKGWEIMCDILLLLKILSYKLWSLLIDDQLLFKESLTNIIKRSKDFESLNYYSCLLNLDQKESFGQFRAVSWITVSNKCDLYFRFLYLIFNSEKRLENLSIYLWNQTNTTTIIMLPGVT